MRASVAFFAGAGLLGLALLLWKGFEHREPDATGAAVPDLAPASASSSGSSAGPAEWNAPEGAQVLDFETVLLPDGGHSARSDEVRIGLAYLSDEDARIYEDALLSGEQGAAPDSQVELAVVRRWISVPAQKLADGSVRVGPTSLPYAHRYELRARGEDPLRFYSASFVAQSMPEQVRPVVAAGLRIHREPSREQDVSVLLRRSGAAAHAALWQDLLAREVPHLLDAYAEQPLAVEPVQILAPLPPGSIEVVLLVRGIEAERKTIDLVAGQVLDLRFDPVMQEVARAVGADLHLTFVIGGTGQPVSGLKVTWFGQGRELRRESDASGTLTFEGVDLQRPQRFNLQFPATPESLPRWPEHQPIELNFDAASLPSPESTQPRHVRRTVELVPLQWLTLRYADPAAPVAAGGGVYPIFVLQRHVDGQWMDDAADHFVSVPGGMAISVQRPGELRVAMLQSPWSVLYSASIDTRVATADGEHVVTLIPNAGRTAELTLLKGGLPQGNTMVLVYGAARGAPPTSLTTDGAGRVRLDAVTVPDIYLEAGSTAVRAMLGSDAVRVELTPEQGPEAP